MSDSALHDTYDALHAMNSQATRLADNYDDNLKFLNSGCPGLQVSGANSPRFHVRPSKNSLSERTGQETSRIIPGIWDLSCAFHYISTPHGQLHSLLY